MLGVFARAPVAPGGGEWPATRLRITPKYPRRRWHPELGPPARARVPRRQPGLTEDPALLGRASTRIGEYTWTARRLPWGRPGEEQAASPRPPGRSPGCVSRRARRRVGHTCATARFRQSCAGLGRRGVGQESPCPSRLELDRVVVAEDRGPRAGSACGKLQETRRCQASGAVRASSRINRSWAGLDDSDPVRSRRRRRSRLAAALVRGTPMIRP